MKKLICNELWGACDKEFVAETLEEMMKRSQEHGMTTQDDAHMKAMEEMKMMMTEDGAEQKFMAEFHKKFEEAPEA
ncbi:DUF1059 domain-containing protein [Patescibacteria group bacterium]